MYSRSVMATTTTSVYSHITKNPKVRCGKPCIEGTRVAVEDIAFYFQRGYPAERIKEEFTQLNLARSTRLCPTTTSVKMKSTRRSRPRKAPQKSSRVSGKNTLSAMEANHRKTRLRKTAISHDLWIGLARPRSSGERVRRARTPRPHGKLT